jgi:hypothetical protein
MSRFKIIVFLMAVSILAAILATAYYFYIHVIAPDAATETQITAMKGKGAAPPDPGIKRFEKAIEFIQDSDLNSGRSALYELVRTFPESSRVTESKRIIGEMNMDMLFDSELNPLKKDYIVQPGDSLNLIARKQQTTVECVMRANGLQSGMLQPGDHLFVFPLDFSLVISVSGKTVTLLRNDRFFREYVALDAKLPVPKAPYEAKVSDKPAWVHGKRSNTLSSDFMSSDKWITIEKKDKSSFNIRALPKAKPTDIINPAPAKSKGKGSVKKPQKGETLAGTTVDDDEIDPTAGTPANGIFLPTEDVEELFTILRTGTPVKVLR